MSAMADELLKKFEFESVDNFLRFQESDSDNLPFNVFTTSDNLPPYEAEISPIDEFLPEYYTVKTRMDARHTFKLSFDIKSKYKIRHETVAAYCELGSSDVKFCEDSRFSHGIHDPDVGRMSPDARLEINDQVIWFEIGTVNTHSHQRMIDSAERKISKYADAVRRLEWNDKIAVLIVGHSGVVSNFPLPVNVANGLVAFYRLGALIESQFKRKKGIEIDKPEDDHIRGRELLKGLVEHPHKEKLDHFAHSNKDLTYEGLLIDSEISEEWSKLYADNDFLAKTISSCKNTMDRDIKGRKDGSEYLKKFISESRKDPQGMKRETRYDMKSVVQLPVIDPIVLSDDDLMFPDGTTSEEDAISKFILAWVDVEFQGMPREEKIKLAELSEYSAGDWPQVARKTGKVKVEVDDDALIRYQRSGVRSKNVNDPVLREKSRQNKLCYDWEDCYTDDIDEYLESMKTWFKPTDYCVDPLGKVIRPLIERANEVAFETKTDRSDYNIRSFSSTKIGRSLILLDWIVQEANIGLAKQCGKGEYYIKKHPTYSLWMVTVSSGISKNVHFKIFCKLNGLEFTNEYIMPCSKEPSKFKCSDGNTILSWDFMSLNRHKATHYLSCFEKICGNVFMWLDLDGILWEDYERNVTRGNYDSWIHSAMYFSLLAYLHDKQGVVDCLQNIRYAYMECMNGSALPIHPYKIFKKFGQCRSRLQSWIFKQLVKNLDVMWMKKPVPALLDDKDPNKNKDLWFNLISWIDGVKIQRMDQALCLMYLGVLHNKNEGDEFQANFQIFQKIIKEEITLMTNSRKEFMGLKEPDLQDIRSHEFSPKMVSTAGKLTKAYLKRKFGTYNSWKNNMLDRLARSMSEDPLKLATMKASALEPDEFTQCVKNGQNHRNKRALEAIAKEVRNEDLDWRGSLSNINESIDRLEREGMHVSLFKKNQLTGVREIFILSMNSRRCVYLLETVSRLICDDLPMEMLTKGRQKIDRAKSHFHKVKKHLDVEAGEDDKELFHCATSGDCTTWCQQFIMRTFACLLKQILPDELYWPIARILNCVTTKRLRLPDSMLSKFREVGMSIASVDDGMNMLKAEFLGISDDYVTRDPILIEKGNRLMYNRSNMMQGILHFTSSLLHCSATLYQEDIMKMLLKDIKVSCTTQLSSDDFGWLITARTKGKKERAKVCWAHLLSLKIYPLFNIKISEEKSTLCGTNGLYEFNSFFLSLNTYCIPIIKYVYSSMIPKIKTRFDDKFHNYSNLLKQVLESGGSLSLVSIIQKLQARIHYSTLGAHVDNAFDYYRDKLLDNTHPVFGFFAFEPVPGLLGHNYAKYRLLTSSDKQMYLEARVLSTFKADILNTGVSFSLRFLMGKEKAYENFKRRLEDYVDLEEFRSRYDMSQVENHTELYTRPSDKDALLRILSMRATSPGVSESMSFDSANKLYAAASYILWSPVCCINSKNSEEDNSDSSKVSLIGAMDKIDENLDVDVTWLKTLYPMRSYYEEMNTYIEQYHWQPIVHIERNRKIIKFNLIRDNYSVPISLEEVVKNVWFGFSTRYTKFELKSAWSKYKSVYPWLHDSYTESCMNSPFRDGISLKNFVSTVCPGKVNLEIISTFQGQSYGYIFPRIISKTMYRGHKLTKRETDVSKEQTRSDRYSELMSTLNKAALIIVGPRSENVLTELRDLSREAFFKYDLEVDQLKKKRKGLYRPMRMIEREDELYTEIKRDTELLSRKNLKMWMFLRCLVLDQRRTAHDLVNLIKVLRMGFLGAYIRRQKLGKSGYYGYGEYEAHAEGDVFRLCVMDDEIIKIIVKSELSLKLLKRVGFDKIIRAMSHKFKIRRGYHACSWDVDTWSRAHGQLLGLNMEIRPDLEGALNPDDLNLRTEITNGQCRIINTHDGFESTVFSFYPNADISKSEKFTTANPSEAWFENKPLRCDIAQSMINKNVNNNNHLSRWISKSLTERLEFRRLKIGDVAYTYERLEDPEDELLMAQLQEELNLIESGAFTMDDVADIANQFETEFTEGFETDWNEELDMGDFNIMDNFLDGMMTDLETTDMRRRISIYSQHCIWDSLIDEILKNKTARGLLNDLNSTTKVVTNNVGYNNFLNMTGNDDKPNMREIECGDLEIDMSFDWRRTNRD